MASEFALKYLYLIPKEKHIDVLKAVWCHDTIEDTRRSYNDIKKKIGQPGADMVFAVTNEKGKNRHERANDKYYKEMVQVPFAVFVKLCDKLSNATYSKSTGSSMLQTYKEEFSYFDKMTFNNAYVDMYDELNTILS